MRVLTLNTEAYLEQVDKLARMVEAAGLTEADVAVVGVLNSGAIVAHDLMKALHWELVPYFEIALHRSTTKAKNAATPTLLSHLPYSVLNAMRIVESRLLNMIGSKKPKDVNIPLALAEITLAGNKMLLIIDDAIDSGRTLLSISESLRAINPQASIKIATITTTTSKPAVTADFCLFNDKTLIRFPWARDAKQ